jgi:hypothetical protein
MRSVLEWIEPRGCANILATLITRTGEAARMTDSILPLTLPTRIRRRIRQEGDCWIWIGEIRKHDGRPILLKEYAYRAVYEAVIGEIPEGEVLHHRTCGIKACVNPHHTVPLTQGDHMREHGFGGDKNVGQALKTHCPHGHAYDEENTIITRESERLCRECLRQRASVRYYANLESNRQKAREYQRRKRDGSTSC